MGLWVNTTYVSHGDLEGVKRRSGADEAAPAFPRDKVEG